MRVRKLLPELLKETSPKDSLLLYSCRAIAEEINRADSLAINLTRVKMAEENINLYEALRNDNAAGAFVNLVAQYQKNSQSRSYLIGESFFQELEQISINEVRCADLILGCGYIQLPYSIEDHDGDLLRGFYFYHGAGHLLVRNTEEVFQASFIENAHKSDSSLCLAWVYDDNDYMGYTHRPSIAEMRIRDLYKNVDFYTRYLTEQGANQHIQQKDGFEPHIQTMLRVLVYLNCTNAILTTHRNKLCYRGGTTRVVNKDRILAKEDLVLVNYNYRSQQEGVEHEVRTVSGKTYKKRFWTCPWYLADRWIGSGDNKQRKKTLIKGSLRERQALKDN